MLFLKKSHFYCNFLQNSLPKDCFSNDIFHLNQGLGFLYMEQAGMIVSCSILPMNYLLKIEIFIFLLLKPHNTLIIRNIKALLHLH